jgi:hypothetical protein
VSWSLSLHKELTMTFVNALIVLAIAGLIVGGVVFLLSKKKLPLPPIRILKSRSPATSEEKTALVELAQGAVSRFPELGSTPAELLAEIDAFCKKAHGGSDNTARLILEKMLTSGSLQQAMSYWQVHAFLDYRGKLKKARQA